jgi:hypothetical protein
VPAVTSGARSTSQTRRRSSETAHSDAPKNWLTWSRHGGDKLLQDVQTYHDMHHEIINMKMHQITPPRNGGKYGEKPCENPQCSECPKPRHLAVRYSSSSQAATVQRVPNGSNKTRPSASATGNSITSKSSPQRQIAAAMPSPPKIDPAPSNLFDNANNPGDNIFLSPPVFAAKWDPKEQTLWQFC